MPLTCTDPDGDPFTLSIADGPSKGSLGAIVGRRGHLHARRRLLRRGLVQLPSERRRGGLGSGDRLDHGDARAELRRRRAHDGGRRPRHGAAHLHRPRRRPGHARDRGAPSKGSLGAMSGGSVTYTPDDGAFGADTFTYTGSDGVADSAPPPSRSRSRGRPPATTSRAARGRDRGLGAPRLHGPGRRPLTLSIEDGPSKGSLGPISGGSVTYTPDGGAFGTDTFTYGASDGTAHAAPATVTITISRPPSCDDVSRRTAVGRGGRGAAELHGSGGRRADAVGRRRARRTGSLGAISGTR